MKIAIISNLLQRQHPTGIETYLHNLVLSLADFESLQLTLLCDENPPTGFVPESVQLKKTNVPIGIKPTKLSSIFQKISGLDNYDVLHCPTVMAPLGVMKKNKLKTIMTVHDMVPAQFPKLSNLRKFVYYKYFLKHLFRKIDHLIVPSKAVAKDLIRVHNVNPVQVSVIYEGVSLEFCRGKEEKENYILAVGTIEPRKNIRRLIQAYMRLRDINHIQENLVIVGKQGWSYDDVYDIPEAFRDNIIFKGYVSKKELIELYQKAKLFVYPSLYEGFGLPVAEAMACGCPVVTSNLSSLPEVAGNACLLVDPYNVTDISSAMLKVLENDQFANCLIDKGQKRAVRFTWSRCALETKKVYEMVLVK